jgi:hypothetical protein
VTLGAVFREKFMNFTVTSCKIADAFAADATISSRHGSPQSCPLSAMDPDYFSIVSYSLYLSRNGTFPFAFLFAVAFSATNVALMLVPVIEFIDNGIQRGVIWIDLFFVTTTLYLLRVPGTYIYIAFVGIFLLAVVWRDLRLVLFPCWSSASCLEYSNISVIWFQLSVNIRQFLTGVVLCRSDLLLFPFKTVDQRRADFERNAGREPHCRCHG